MASAFSTIDPAALRAVTGGRYTAGPERTEPALIRGIGELARAVTEVGQGLAAVKQQSDSQQMQMMQQMMQSRGR